MVSVSVKHFWLSGWGAPPAPKEHIVAMTFPMIYLEPGVANELVSKVSGATVLHVAKEFPEHLIKKGKACELRSKWSY